jgi:hypothetical protein
MRRFALAIAAAVAAVAWTAETTERKWRSR